MPHRQPKAAWKKAQARSRASATRETSSSTADAKAADRERYDLIERRIKERVAACEKSGQRCNVASFFDGLKYFEIAQMKIRDVRLVYAPAEAPACSAVRPTTGAGRACPSPKPPVPTNLKLKLNIHRTLSDVRKG